MAQAGGSISYPRFQKKPPCRKGFPLARINPVAEVVAQQFFGDGGEPVRTSAAAVWLCNREAGTLLRIDPKLVIFTSAE